MSGKNIDPLKDIDFAAMGVMADPKFDNDDPETPPAPDDDPKPKPGDLPGPDDDSDEDSDDDAPPKDDDDDDRDPYGRKRVDDSDDDHDPDPDDDDEDDEPKPKKKKKAGDDDPDADDPDPDADPEAEPPSVVSELIELVGYDDINPEDFDDSVEGIGRLTQTLAERLAIEFQEAEYTQLPAVKEFRDYVANGGDPDKYHEVRGQAYDYEQMTIDEGNETQQETIVRQALSRQDHEKEEIDSIIEKYKAGGILKDQAEMALKGLKRQAAKQKEQLTAQQQQIREQQQEQIQTFWTEVETKLKETDTFKGITIPKKERQEFFEYISKPVKEGYSQRDLDALELGLEEKIAIDYLIMKGFPLADLVDKKASTKAASDLRKRLKSGGDPKPRKSSPPKPAAKTGQPSVADLDLM